MADLNFITWKWADKYNEKDVIRLANKVREHCSESHTFNLFTDKAKGGAYPDYINVRTIKDRELMARNCYCRLRMFDPAWQTENNLNGRIVSLDLDLVITGTLDGLFTGGSSFKILQGANAVNPNPFNASVMLLRSGRHDIVWRHFSVEAASRIKYHEFPDDQGWIWHKLPLAEGWVVGSSSGIYAFKKPGWPMGSELPNDARIVAFIGKRKPHMYTGLTWIQQHWNFAA